MSTGSPVSTPTAALDPETQRQRLAHWLAARLPDVSELQVSPLQRPNSGISNETYFLDLHYVQAGKTMQRSLVVRWPPWGVSTTFCEV
jgi:hypothetical protein